MMKFTKIKLTYLLKLSVKMRNIYLIINIFFILEEYLIIINEHL